MDISPADGTDAAVIDGTTAHPTGSSRIGYTTLPCAWKGVAGVPQTEALIASQVAKIPWRK